MAFRCWQCDNRRDKQIAFCPSCDEETDAYYDDGSYADKDRDTDAYLARFRKPLIREQIAAADKISSRAVAMANIRHETGSREWWAMLQRECCARPDYLPRKDG